MIQFFVNDKEVILPADYSFTMIENNPEINAEGEISLDITASLREPKNVIAFGFLNRLNLATITKTADARMVEDGISKFGTITITSNTDKSVTFQFLSGNSELNFLSKNEKKIWELDWGTETEIDLSRAITSLTDDSLNFVCSPTLIGDEIVNDYLVENQANSFAIVTSFYNVDTNVPLSAGNYYTLATAIAAVPSGSRRLALAIEFKTDEETTVRYQYQWYNTTKWTIISEDAGYGVTNVYWQEASRKIIMQPKLLYYVRKLPELLGYTTLKYNVLDTYSRATKMCLTNSVESLSYADALPDWTVSEFIEAVENEFNVTFLVDSKDKSISIHSLPSSIADKKTVTIANVLDDYVRDFSQTSKSIKLDFTKVSYDVPDSDYFKYNKLSDVIIQMCEIKEFANYAAIKTYINTGVCVPNALVIYRDLANGNDYFLDVDRSGNPTKIIMNYDNFSGHRLYHINKFKSYGSTADRELILKISPASMDVILYNFICQL